MFPVCLDSQESVLWLVQSHMSWWMSMHVLFSAKMKNTSILLVYFFHASHADVSSQLLYGYQFSQNM